MADGPLAEVGVAGIIIILVLQMVFGYMKARNGKRNSNPGYGVTLAPNQRVGLDQVSHDKLQRIEDGINEVNQALIEVLVLLRSRTP